MIEGFAGVKIRRQDFINPSLPANWDSVSFNIRVNDNLTHNHKYP